MIRITTIFLCLLLAVAAAGRYRAEESVREIRNDIEKLEQERKIEEQRISTLRADIAYLESPERLAKIAKAKTTLRAPETAQFLTASDYIASFGDGAIDELAPPNAPMNGDTILHALAMASLSRVE